MGNIFNAIIIQPLLNLVMVLYSIMPGHDFGLAIIAITIIIRAILWPLSAKSLHGQKALKELQPEIDKIKKKYKNNPQAMQKAMAELYKEKEISPFSSCLPTLLQFPILIGLYWVFVKFKDPAFIQVANTPHSVVAQLYSWVKQFPPVHAVVQADGSLKTTFLGLVNLAKPSIILAILAGATQFVQTKLMTPNKPDDATQKMMANMVFLFPVITIVISLSLPAALPLYWTVSTAIAAFQQYLVMHKEVTLFEHLGLKKSKNKDQASK